MKGKGKRVKWLTKAYAQKSVTLILVIMSQKTF